MISIGQNAGSTYQAARATAVGSHAGSDTQLQDAVAIGYKAGEYGQTTEAIAIGNGAGNTGQGQDAVAIGGNAGATKQAQYAVAIGENAGSTSQEANSLVIGSNISTSVVATNYSILIGTNIDPNGYTGVIMFNASSTTLTAGFSQAFYVNPVRAITGTLNNGTPQMSANDYILNGLRLVYYNPTTKEIVAIG